MERTEHRDCSIIYNLHIQLKHWQEVLQAKGRIKNHNKKNLRASRSRSNRCPNNAPYRGAGFYSKKRGVTASVHVWAEGGSNNGTNQKRNGTAGGGEGTEWKSHDGRWFPLLRRLALIDPPRGGDPAHHDRQHHGFSISLLVCFCFHFLSSFIRKCFIAKVAWGRPLCLSSSPLL